MANVVNRRKPTISSLKVHKYQKIVMRSKARFRVVVAGRRWGKRKLAPRVSPGKSWEGVYGGLAATMLLALLFALWQPLGVMGGVALIVITAVVTLTSVLGDLFESMLKRYRNIKDSSQLLPGHGGVLDRIDSLTAAIPIFALLYLQVLSLQVSAL